MGIHIRKGGRKAHQSKRLTGAQKAKVRDYGRNKERKERKIAQEQAAMGLKKRFRRDPGIPSIHPLKDQILAEAVAIKAKREEERERQREARRQVFDKSRNLDMEDLQQDAAKRSDDYDELRNAALTEHHQLVSKAPVENSRRAFFREFKKVVESADVILQVLDARDPIGCRSSQVEKAVLASANKKLVLILNKVDLVPVEVVKKWLAYLRNEFPTIAFKSSTQNQRNNLSQSKADVFSESAGSECRGADTLISLLSNYCRNSGIKTAIRVGVVGYPNVGKSSIINSLKRSRACNVGAHAGVTRATQEVSLDKRIKLIDSPGIVFASGTADNELILRNCVNPETLLDPVGPVEAILAKCDHDQIREMYEIPEFTNVTQFLQQIGRRFGKVKKGGVPDVMQSAKLVLQHWNCGKISYYTIPPATHTLPTHVDASVVAAWSAAFDMKSLLQTEDDAVLLGLKPVKEYKNAHVSQAAPMVDDDAAEAEDDDDYEDVESGEEDSDGMDQGDDDDEEEEEDEDEMDTAASTAKPAVFKTARPMPFKPEVTTVVSTTKKLSAKLQREKQAAGPVGKKEATYEGADLNVQANKGVKKQQKSQSKEKRRAMRAARNGTTAEDETDEVVANQPDYNFATDFVDF